MIHKLTNIIAGEKYVLDLTNKTVLEQPSKTKLIFSQVLQLIKDNLPITPLPIELTKQEIDDLIREEFKKNKNIKEKV